MTAQDIINEARRMISDSSAVRWPNSALLVHLGSVLDELWVRRQSAFYTAGIVTSMPTKPAAVGDTVYIQDSYRLPAAHYIAFLCFMEDSDDAANARLAKDHFDLFEKGMG
jgi:hypothetical protein